MYVTVAMPPAERAPYVPAVPCLQRALAKLRAISQLHERLVEKQDVEKWILPAFKLVFSGNGRDEGLSCDQREAAIEEFTFRVANMKTNNDIPRNLMSSEGKKSLGDILLNEEYKALAPPSEVRNSTMYSSHLQIDVLII